MRGQSRRRTHRGPVRTRCAGSTQPGSREERWNHGSSSGTEKEYRVGGGPPGGPGKRERGGLGWGGASGRRQRGVKDRSLDKWRCGLL